MQNNLRLVKITELDFLICIQNNLFGRNSDFIKSWKEGDSVVFVIQDKIAGVGNVFGKMFRSDSPLWVNEYPFRIPINFTHLFSIKNRPLFEKHKKELFEIYGNTWGHVFVLRKSLPESVQNSILENISNFDQDPEEVLNGIRYKIQRQIEQHQDSSLDRLRIMEEKLSDDEKEEELTFEDKRDSLILRMIQYIRNDPERFENLLKEDSFISTLSEEEKKYLKEVEYSYVKEEVFKLLTKQGLYRSLWPEYGKGTYLICGDSHGDHTYSGMFDLIRNINNFLNIDKIFHIGHLVDDNNIINNEWKKFGNLVIVSRIEEAYKIEDFIKDSNIEVVRDGVFLGAVKVVNQDLVSDYMPSRPTSSVIRKKPYMDITILNHHLHEFDVTRSEDEKRIVSGYPGCLCEKHVESSRREIRYEEGILDKIKRNSSWNSRVQRRKWAIKDYWEQGVFVLHVDEDGSYTIVPCRIRKVKIDGKERYAISYFDKIISEIGVHCPDKKIFINADIHTPLHDCEVLDVQDKIVNDYKPDIFINLGDTRNSEGLNHHKWERGEIVTDLLIDEAFSVYHILNKMSSWAKEKYVFFGNHERFASDFTNKFPQFKGLVDFEFLSCYKDLGYEMITLQGKLEIGESVYLHGDLMRGSSVCPLDKLSEAFPNKLVVCGHHHYPSIRKGCYSIGYSGLRDQKYNEKTVTRWCHGFGMCNEFNGVSFLTSLVIENSSIIINGKKYYSNDFKNNWKPPKYDIKIQYKYNT